MSPDRSKVFEKSWETILESGFNRLRAEEYDVQFSYYRYPGDYEAAATAAAEICKLISADTEDDLSLVGRTYTRVRTQVELFLKKKVLQSVRAQKKQDRLLEVLSEEWEEYTRFRVWLKGIFSGLDKIIREHTVFEDNRIFETERLAAECFKKIIFCPLAEPFGNKMVKRFQSHITCMTPTLIDADIALFGGIKRLLKGISSPERDSWRNFREWFILPRKYEYHRMASNWVKTLCLEDFVSCIIRHAEREKIAGQTCFDQKLGNALHSASTQVFFGKYLPKVFRKNTELYKTWVREEDISPLVRVNKAIVWNVDLAEKVTEIFRVSFLQKICSALNIECGPFLAANDKGNFKSPFHEYCPTSRKGGRVLRQEVLCMATVMEAMLDSFGAHANLLKAFSAAGYLLQWCEEVLARHLKACKKCVLPESLLSFCKSVLLKLGYTDASASVLSCRAKVLLFMKYVPKPEPFHRVYTEDLYTRITEDRLTSDAAEQAMLSAFFGSEEDSLIRKGMRMLRDNTQSRKLFKLFSSSPSGAAFQEQNTAEMTFTVNVFLNGTIKRRKPCIISAPRAIQACHQSYETFFKTHQESAELEWNYMLGRVTVETHLFCNGHKESTMLELSVEQYSVLNLFQEIDSVSVRSVIDSIVEAPQGSCDRERTLRILNYVILSMMVSQCPLLRKSPDNSILAETDTLTLNTMFKSDRSQIKLPEPEYDDTSHSVRDNSGKTLR